MSIRNKMFICIVIFLILPFLILGFLYYGMLLDTTKDNLNRSSYKILEQMERSIQIKTNRLKTKTDVLIFDRQFQQLLRNTDFSAGSADNYDSLNSLGGIMEQYFYDENDLESIIVFKPDGGIYTYKGSKKEESIVSFITKYGRVSNPAGELAWFSISGVDSSFPSSAGTTLVAGVNLADTNFIKDQKLLATVYFIYNTDFFSSVSAPSAENSEIFMICTADGNKIYSRGAKRVPQLWEISIDAAAQIHKNTQGSLRLSLDGEDSILVFYTSPSLGWKYVRIVKYADYFAEAEYMRHLTIAIAVILFLFLCVANVLWLRHLTKPVVKIVGAMDEVGKRNFDVELTVDSRDEFGIIARGFNTMVSEIKALFRQVVEEEEKSKEAELAALQYQINPHFLYNTISAIRLTSIFNRQYDVAQMLSLLGNFLHNTLGNINKRITLEDEFKNMKDYISLYQIRFNNQIEAQFVIEEGLEQSLIHSMMIQPLVENAIMHGLNKRLGAQETAVVRISAERDGEQLLIKVWDNGVGMTKQQCREAVKETNKKQSRVHIGLPNINKRIHYLYGTPYGLSIASELDKYTEVTISLPLILPQE